jgi:hypothetical protein
MRQEAQHLPSSVPRRSASRQAEDAAGRARAASEPLPFAYAHDTPQGPPDSCEAFMAADSSLNILELMGPLPEAGDTRDSDQVMISRMSQPQLQQAAQPPPGR